MQNSRQQFICDDDQEDDCEVNTTLKSYLDADESQCYQEFQEEDDQFDLQSFQDQSNQEEELFYEFKNGYNERTYVDFPALKLFDQQVDNLAKIPSNFKFNDLREYQETMNKLQIESYFFDLRKSMKENLKQSKKQYKNNSTFAEFQFIQNYKVAKVGFNKHGFYLTINAVSKVLKYQKEQWQIKNNQLLIFQHKNSNKRFTGKAIVVSQDNEEKDIQNRTEIQQMNKIHRQNQKIIQQLLSDERGETELYKTILQQQNDQFQLIDFHQNFDIRMNTKDDLKFFLMDIKKIEQEYILLTPNEYYLSLQKIQNSHIQFKFLNYIAFEDQTVFAKKGETIFPNYEFFENKKIALEFYKKLIEKEIKEATKLDNFQKQALSHALHNQNSLIQGPPGTGKTFLAAYLVNTLIKIKMQFCQKPILVISKKNNSLDQLLLRIIDQNYSVKILRLGFMSQNETIKQLTVQEQKGPKKIQKYDKYQYERINKMLQDFIEKNEMRKLDQQQENDLEQILYQMEDYQDKYIRSTISSDMIYQNKLANFMKQYEVIGMTLTAYHIHFEALRQLQAEIVVVEEASEIIESDFFPVLTPWLKHLIQLGDHQQLRPFQRNKTLEEDYNYKMSYFERLITVNQIKLITLYQQRRMRPEFADFTRLFYGKKYQDDPSVKSASFIKEISLIGMYLLPHTYPETMMRDRSYINQYEAIFIKILVSILASKYKQYQITVLSMYKSQKILIQNKLSGFQNVLSFTVDEFQGNESDIIILSCVRSNIQNKCGFIKESHRINVAFSRAKIGFFCIGNFVMYQIKVPTWKKINSLAYHLMIYGGVKQLRLYEKIHYLTENCLQKIQLLIGMYEEDTCNMCSQNSHIGDCILYQQQLDIDYEQVSKNTANTQEIISCIKNEKTREDILSTVKFLQQFQQSQKSNPKSK
ncbi:hypothetical protein ABPG72_014515 [Tetrahymena utriculariae]